MATDIIVSYDGTSNDDDALALGRMLAQTGAALALRRSSSWAERHVFVERSVMSINA